MIFSFVLLLFSLNIKCGNSQVFPGEEVDESRKHDLEFKFLKTTYDQDSYSCCDFKYAEKYTLAIKSDPSVGIANSEAQSGSEASNLDDGSTKNTHKYREYNNLDYFTYLSDNNIEFNTVGNILFNTQEEKEVKFEEDTDKPKENLNAQEEMEVKYKYDSDGSKENLNVQEGTDLKFKNDSNESKENLNAQEDETHKSKEESRLQPINQPYVPKLLTNVYTNFPTTSFSDPFICKECTANVYNLFNIEKDITNAVEVSLHHFVQFERNQFDLIVYQKDDGSILCGMHEDRMYLVCRIKRNNPGNVCFYDTFYLIECEDVRCFTGKKYKFNFSSNRIKIYDFNCILEIEWISSNQLYYVFTNRSAFPINFLTNEKRQDNYSGLGLGINDGNIKDGEDSGARDQETREIKKDTLTYDKNVIKNTLNELFENRRRTGESQHHYGSETIKSTDSLEKLAKIDKKTLN